MWTSHDANVTSAWAGFEPATSHVLSRALSPLCTVLHSTTLCTVPFITCFTASYHGPFTLILRHHDYFCKYQATTWASRALVNIPTTTKSMIKRWLLSWALYVQSNPSECNLFHVKLNLSGENPLTHKLGLCLCCLVRFTALVTCFSAVTSVSTVYCSCMFGQSFCRHLLNYSTQTTKDLQVVCSHTN